MRDMQEIKRRVRQKLEGISAVFAVRVGYEKEELIVFLFTDTEATRQEVLAVVRAEDSGVGVIFKSGFYPLEESA